jgi:hypothetical protein
MLGNLADFCHMCHGTCITLITPGKILQISEPLDYRSSDPIPLDVRIRAAQHPLISKLTDCHPIEQSRPLPTERYAVASRMYPTTCVKGAVGKGQVFMNGSRISRPAGQTSQQHSLPFRQRERQRSGEWRYLHGHLLRAFEVMVMF